jgi:D-aspartate ligase
MKKKFIPIILGTDANAYGMAKSFHQQYRIKSIAIGKKRLYPTRFSSIIDVFVFNNFDTQEIFIKKIIEIAKKYNKKYEKMILISSGDGYTELIVNNYDELSKCFVVPYIKKELKERLENKEEFYKICNQYGLDYPKTFIYTADNKSNLTLPFDFPVAVKPSNSISYLKADFEGKKKAYKANSREELESIINKIYSSTYSENIIIQEFIPGDDSAMYVLNSYSNAKGIVKMMCLGHVILEDYAPNDIGNYTAIMTNYNKDIYEKLEKFLEAIHYVGFSNFDMKYDYRDQKYKLFEINIRQGRSSYVVTGSGNNMAKLLVDEYVDNIDSNKTYNKKEWLWLSVPKSTLYKHVNQSQIKKIRELIEKKQYGHTLFYCKDFNPIRFAIVLKLYAIAQNNYKLYFNKRGLND